MSYATVQTVPNSFFSVRREFLDDVRTGPSAALPNIMKLAICLSGHLLWVFPGLTSMMERASNNLREGDHNKS